jgi:hypothetical protein
MLSGVYICLILSNNLQGRGYLIASMGGHLLRRVWVTIGSAVHDATPMLAAPSRKLPNGNLRCGRVHIIMAQA